MTKGNVESGVRDLSVSDVYPLFESGMKFLVACNACIMQLLTHILVLHSVDTSDAVSICKEGCLWISGWLARGPLPVTASLEEEHARS